MANKTRVLKYLWMKFAMTWGG